MVLMEPADARPDIASDEAAWYTCSVQVLTQVQHAWHCLETEGCARQWPPGRLVGMMLLRVKSLNRFSTRLGAEPRPGIAGVMCCLDSWAISQQVAGSR